MPSIEERLTCVETKLDQLRARVDIATGKGDWIDQITGSFKDDPDFDEILRLGREIRESDRVCAE